MDTDDLLTGTQHVANPGWTALGVVPVAALSALGVVGGAPAATPAPTSSATSALVVKQPVRSVVTPLNWGSVWLKTVAAIQTSRVRYPTL